LYKVRAWLAITELRALSAKWRERRELVAWCEERRGLWGGLYRILGLYYDGNKPSTVMAAIHQGSRRCTRRLGANRARGGAAAPWVRPHPQLLLLA